MERTAPEADLVVQCTSLGMDGSKHDFESLKFVSLLPKSAAVADVIFLPRKTKLLMEAERLGHRVINGMGMLCNQQKAMMKFFLDVDLPDSFYDDAEEALMIATAMREARHYRLERKKRHLINERMPAVWRDILPIYNRFLYKIAREFAQQFL